MIGYQPQPLHAPIVSLRNYFPPNSRCFAVCPPTGIQYHTPPTTKIQCSCLYMQNTHTHMHLGIENPTRPLRRSACLTFMRENWQGCLCPVRHCQEEEERCGGQGTCKGREGVGGSLVPRLPSHARKRYGGGEPGRFYHVSVHV